MKEYDARKILKQYYSILNLAIFYKGFVSTQIVHAQGNQLVPDLLPKPSDTLHKQC